MPRHFMSVVRMQSSSITTTKLLRLDELKANNNIVAAAFESLKEIDNVKSKKSSFYIINNTIDNATTAEEILAISEIGLVSKQHALKVNIIIYNIFELDSVYNNLYDFIYYVSLRFCTEKKISFYIYT